jgi:hypothetical protein
MDMGAEYKRSMDPEGGFGLASDSSGRTQEAVWLSADPVESTGGTKFIGSTKLSDA